MRFKIQMTPVGRDRKIPINYQYEMMSAIYSILSTADGDYAKMLHDEGYASDVKRFKLFCFSNLIGPNGGIVPLKEKVGDEEQIRLNVKGGVVLWYIAFALPEGMQKFVQGLFVDQRIRISDAVGGVTFRITEAQFVPDPEVKDGPIACETLSPISVSKRVEGMSTVTYLQPTDEDYEKALLTGLLERYKALNGKEYEGERYCKLTVVGNAPQSKLITIKAGTDQKTRVRGFKYYFNIELPHELFEIAYNSGLGERCGMGFGMIKVRE